jgi:hypothetical protein
MAVTDPWPRTYCGGGVLSACHDALWNAMSQAAADLQAEFGSANVADWKRQIADETIRHTTVGITGVPEINWQNRPTFQQVVQLRNVDHYECYKAKGTTANRFVTVTDRFGTRSETLVKPDSFCNAVGEDGQAIVDASAHLTCYRVRQAAFAGAAVTAANELASQTLGLTRLRTVCVPSEADGVPSTLGIDHFDCYRASHATPRFTPRSVVLADQWGIRSPLLVRADTVCPPADKNGEGIKDPTVSLACYRMKSPGLFGARSVAVTNQFGTESVRVVKPRTLCVPSSVQ